MQTKIVDPNDNTAENIASFLVEAYPMIFKSLPVFLIAVRIVISEVMVGWLVENKFKSTVRT